MSQYTFDALGTHWVIELMDKSFTKTLTSQIDKKVTTFEKSYSRFSSTSHIGELNTKHVLLDPSDELISMLEYALKIHQETNGLFNISVGAELEKRGYGLPYDNHSRLSYNISNDIHVDKKLITLEPHLKIDFGGFGKGWLIDDIHNMLVTQGYEAFCINGGGDIRTGNLPLDVVIEHPLNTEEYIYSTTLKPYHALAVSSRQKRQWTDKNGNQQNHIINTGIRVNHDIVQVAVTAPTATTADTFATVFFGTDSLNTEQFAKENELEYMIVYTNEYGDLSTLKSKLF